MARASRSISRSARPIATRMKNACGSSMRVAAHMQEVAVVERLQAEKLELQIALRLQRRGEPREIEARQFGIEQFGLDAGLDVGGKYSA